ECAKDCQLVCIEFDAGALDHRQIVMRIHHRGGVSGKMFAAACDALLSHRIIKGAGQPNDLCHVPSVAAATKRIVGLIIEGNIKHRTEIEVEPEEPQKTAG